MARRRRNQKKQDDTLIDVVEAKDQATDFIDANKNLILGGLTLLVLIVGGIFAYNNFYKAPRQAEAIDQMYKAEQQFAKDSFALALTNPGEGAMGFLDIIDSYGGTAAANTANYYAGISYLNLGKFEAAIDFLSAFSPDDKITAFTKYGALADAYSELDKMDEALSYYQKAANHGDNELLTSIYLKKLGLLYAKQGKTEEARSAFQKIKDKYPNSPDGQDIDKYLARLK